MGKIEGDLANKFSLGVNSYTCDLANAKNMIINCKKCVNNTRHTVKKEQQSKKYSEKESDGKLSFIQKDYTKVKCYSFVKMVHISPNFTDNIKK